MCCSSSSSSAGSTGSRHTAFEMSFPLVERNAISESGFGFSIFLLPFFSAEFCFVLLRFVCRCFASQRSLFMHTVRAHTHRQRQMCTFGRTLCRHFIAATSAERSPLNERDHSTDALILVTIIILFREQNCSKMHLDQSHRISPSTHLLLI